MPSDCDTLGDLTWPPKAITIERSIRHVYLIVTSLPWSSRLKVTAEPREAQPEITAMAASGVQASREMPLVQGVLGD